MQTHKRNLKRWKLFPCSPFIWFPGTTHFAERRLLFKMTSRLAGGWCCYCCFANVLHGTYIRKYIWRQHVNSVEGWVIMITGRVGGCIHELVCAWIVKNCVTKEAIMVICLNTDGGFLSLYSHLSLLCVHRWSWWESQEPPPLQEAALQQWHYSYGWMWLLRLHIIMCLKRIPGTFYRPSIQRILFSRWERLSALMVHIIFKGIVFIAYYDQYTYRQIPIIPQHFLVTFWRRPLAEKKIVPQ